MRMNKKRSASVSTLATGLDSSPSFYQLPAAGHATPATYAIDGRQVIVIAAGGGRLGTPAGDQYLAFALPVAAPEASE